MKLRIPYLALLAAPLALFGIGAALNILAISVNHGVMPVVWPTSSIQHAVAAGWAPGMLIDDSHKLMEHGDHLKFLCDWINLPHVGTASIGDGFIYLSDYVQNYVYGAWLALVARDSFKG